MADCHAMMEVVEGRTGRVSLLHINVNADIIQWLCNILIILHSKYKYNNIIIDYTIL